MLVWWSVFIGPCSGVESSGCTRAQAVSEPAMGCMGSKANECEKAGTATTASSSNSSSKKKVVKPKPWKHPTPLSRSELNRMREEFWDTSPHYGGQREIWDALKAACEAEKGLAQAIVDSANIFVDRPDLSVCYDERGAKYELPKFVLSDPTNLIKDP